MTGPLDELPVPPAIEARIKPKPWEKALDILALVSPIILLILWEAASRVGALDARFFPAPSRIAGTFWSDMVSGELVDDIGATLARFWVGYIAGSVLGVLVGLTLGLFRRIRQFTAPILSALYTIPKIAILPLILFIFGIGETSKYIIIGIAAFFLVAFNTMSGVLQTPPIFLDVARIADASKRQVYFTVALPAALPSIFTGLRLAAGTSYVIIAAAEFVGAKSGVGYYIWYSWQIFAVSKMFVGIVVVSVMGYLTIVLIDGLERLMVPQTGVAAQRQ
jgi:NitT/TauT family transport system permease protein